MDDSTGNIGNNDDADDGKVKDIYLYIKLKIQNITVFKLY